MANPNIVNVTTINGNNAGLAVTSSAQDLVSNADASGKVYKINAIVVANVDGSSADSVSVTLIKDVTGTPATFHIAKAIAVPAGASLDVLPSPIYLLEDEKIQVVGVAASGDLEAIATWEEIS